MNYLNDETNYVQEDWYYIVHKKQGGHVAFLRRQEALEYYSKYGTRLDIKYKLDKLGTKTILDRPNIDIERVRNDLTLKKTPKSVRKAIDKYDKANNKQIALKLNKKYDKEILDYLDSVDNKQGLIKQLLREHIQKQIQENTYKYILINARGDIESARANI